jgi:hypothetical protein
MAEVTISCPICAGKVTFEEPKSPFGGASEGWGDGKVRFEWLRAQPDCGHCAIDSGTMTEAEVRGIAHQRRSWAEGRE